MKRTRTVFGRLKNVECESGVFSFEMRRDGVFVRRRHAREKTRIPFAALAEGGRLPVRIGEQPVVFTLTSRGLMVQTGNRPCPVLPYQTLFNLSQKQPELL